MPYFKQQEVINAGAYMRLSREDSRMGESNSILNQRQFLSDYINTHGMTMVDEYIDDGYTGTNFDQSAFQALIEDCKSKKLNCVIVKDLSRLGRDATMAGRYIDEIFPSLGIRL